MKVKNGKKRVAVAMSGGVDSSVAAHLLKKRGFEVYGFFMRSWNPLTNLPNDCPWQEDFEDVRRVCNYLNIPYTTLNFEKEYKARVLDYFLNEYQAGRTPNPDVLCNSEIKFRVFWQKVKSLGFDYMATGHYAKIENGKLVRPKDEQKNQTYFLCKLTSEQVENVLFPLADLTKAEVRQIAKEAALPTASKKDSQGICFIGKLSVREFLKNSLELKPGKVLAADGTVLGEHEGAQLYTIGQRHIGVAAAGKKLYVAGKDMNTNTVVMAGEEALYSRELKFAKAHWLLDERSNEFECDVQLRYRTASIRAKITYQHTPVCQDEGIVVLSEAARAVTPGQYVAFYKNDRLLGGAVIQ